MRERFAERRVELVLLAIVVAVALPYAVYGPGYVLDDWFALANAQLDGAWSAAGRNQWLARPGAGLAYAVVFGALGGGPAAAYALLVATVAVTAVVMFRVGLHLWPRPVSASIAGLWVVIPNHTSLTYWPSAGNIALALLLTLVGWLVLLGGQTGRRLLVAGTIFGLGVLCYEAVAPAALVGSWYLLRRAHGVVIRRSLIATVVPVGAALAWIVVFWNPGKRGINETADLRLAFPAHFGWGVAPSGLPSYALGIAAAIGITIMVARAVDPRRRAGLLPAERLALAGLATIAAGTVPFVRYVYEPLGAGDRVNVVASVGTAMVWVAFGWLTQRALPTLAFAAAGSVVLLAFATSQHEAARAWSDAGRHAEAEVARLAEESPCDASISIHQGPIERNVAAFLDRSNATGAASVACDRRVARVRLVTRPGRG